MKGLGCTLVILGLGALILPLIGIQFRIVDALSESGTPIWLISLLLIAGGLVLLFINNTSRQDPSQIRSRTEPAGTLHNTNNDVDQMVQNTANDMMKMTRDALAKGLSPEEMVDILVSKMGFPQEAAQRVVSNLLKEVRKETYAQDSSDIINTKTSSHTSESDDPDVLLMQSGLTQAVMADIALGVDRNITISTLVAVGMNEAKARAYVRTLSETFMEMPDEQRKEIQRNMKERMEIIDKALSNDVDEDVLVEGIMKAEGFTRQQAEGIVNYCVSVYRIRKSRK
jgi:hypothetical protein